MGRHSWPVTSTAVVPPPGRTLGPVRRAAQLLVGLVLYAFSIALLVRAGLGTMPWDVLSQGLAGRLGWSFGTVTIVTSVVVLLCWIPLRQRPGVGTIANVIVIGVLVDPFLALLARLPEPLPLAGSLAMAAIGIVGNGVATACYIGTRLGPGPRDGLMTGLVVRTGWSVRLIRSAIEVTVVSAGWLLGGTVGLATLAYALAIGPLVHLLLPRFMLPVEPAPTQPARAQPALDGPTLTEPDGPGTAPV